MHQFQTSGHLTLHSGLLLRRQCRARTRRYVARDRTGFSPCCMHESRNHLLFQQFGVMLRATACGCVIENILVASRTFRRG